MFKWIQLYLTMSKEGLASISCQSIELLVMFFMGEIAPPNGGFTIQIHLATSTPILPVIKIPKISISTNPHVYFSYIR